MAKTDTQTYANHAHRPTQTLIAFLFAFAALSIFAVNAFGEPTLVNLGLLSLSCAAIMLVGMSRTYIVRLQDRIIRLEMRLRLERLGRGADVGRLGHQQIVALRFASDEEMPELIDRALSERLTSDQIKKAVKDWQADGYRT